MHLSVTGVQGGNMIYVHRKTVYESIGLESIILGTKKGFLPINSIITDLGFDFSQVWKFFFM